MPINTYDKKDTVTLRVIFTSSSVNTDPTTVTLKVKDPEGAITTYTYAGGTITKEAVGIYSKDLVPTNDGVWYYNYEGTGACQAAAEGSFIVRKSEF